MNCLKRCELKNCFYVCVYARSYVLPPPKGTAESDRGEIKSESQYNMTRQFIIIMSINIANSNASDNNPEFLRVCYLPAIFRLIK